MSKNHLIQAFLNDNLPNDIALIFFASVKFLEVYPHTVDEEWKNNMGRWIKSFRNMLANYNNTQRIDKRWRYENALSAISAITDDLKKFGDDNSMGVSDRNYVLQFFSSIKDKTYVGIDNQALKEESDKAELVLSGPQWESVITSAENDPYLWGQIRALLQWSDGNIEKFKSYFSKLSALLSFINEDPNSFYIASLIINPKHWQESNRLYQLNLDRDNSFRRYLRDFDKTQSANAPNIKAIIDLWIETANELDVKEFISRLLCNKNYTNPAWVECIIEEPSILDYSNNKRIFLDKGHVILAQYKTKDSHCIDPILKYIHTVGLKSESQDHITFNDSKGDSPHSISYVAKDDAYQLKWSNTDGMYDLIGKDGDTETYCAKDAIAKFINILKH